MTTQVVLLSIITACSLLLAVVTLVLALALLRVAGHVKELQGRVDGALREVERELLPTLREFRATASSLTGLSSTGTRLIEGALYRRWAPGAGAGPTGPMSWLPAAVDIAWRFLRLGQQVRAGADRGAGSRSQTA
jgi:hypothetical protein